MAARVWTGLPSPLVFLRWVDGRSPPPVSVRRSPTRWSRGRARPGAPHPLTLLVAARVHCFYLGVEGGARSLVALFCLIPGKVLASRMLFYVRPSSGHIGDLVAHGSLLSTPPGPLHPIPGKARVATSCDGASQRG